jgi:hypothetical protein
VSAGRCDWCARLSTDARLCHDCTRLLRRALVDLAAFLPDLDVTVARQDRVTRAAVHTHAPVVEAPAHCPQCAGDGPIVHTLVARPLPFDPGAADLRFTVVSTLMSWVAELAARHHISTARPDLTRTAAPVCAEHRHDGRRRLDCGHTSCPVVCSTCRAARRQQEVGPAAVEWLRANVRAIRQDDQARAVLRDLLDAARRVEQAIDRRDPEVYAGPCDAPEYVIEHPDGTVEPGSSLICGTDLYARFGDTHVTCRSCGYRYDVAERKAWLLDQVREVWARPAVIVAALTSLNMPLSQDRLDKWISRDREQHGSGRPRRVPYPPILQVGTDYVDEHGRDVMVPLLNAEGEPVVVDGVPVLKQAGRALYRVGDVIDRLTALAQIEQTRQAAG